MIKTQVEIPKELFRRAQEAATARNWTSAEIVRRGLEQMVLRHPVPPELPQQVWHLPGPVDLGLIVDPFADPDWRVGANLSVSAARLVAETLRARASLCDEGT